MHVAAPITHPIILCTVQHASGQVDATPRPCTWRLRRLQLIRHSAAVQRAKQLCVLGLDLVWEGFRAGADPEKVPVTSAFAVTMRLTAASGWQDVQQAAAESLDEEPESASFRNSNSFSRGAFSSFPNSSSNVGPASPHMMVHRQGIEAGFRV